jgi:hypothetical protein
MHPDHMGLAHWLVERFSTQAHGCSFWISATDYYAARVASQSTTGFGGEAAARFFAAHGLRDPQALACALGEYLSEPKASVWFEAGPDGLVQGRGVRLHLSSRMLYDAHHVFINGEAFVARGPDARLMRQLADERRLAPALVHRLSDGARQWLGQWLADGWLELDARA